jgi:hypothetical protein
LVSVEEYLHTLYRPDCDYVDGALEERNVGEVTHAMAQQDLVAYLRERRALWNMWALREVRVQVLPIRYRRAWIYTQDEIREVRDGLLRTRDPE